MVDIQFLPTDSKQNVIQTIVYMLQVQQLQVIEENFTKPWGAYWRISDEDLGRFVEIFFPANTVSISPKVPQSPKILLVAPHQRLSWQYHHRRAEIWSVVHGPIEVVRSITDDPVSTHTCKTNSTVTLVKEERHRLVGLDNWGVVAEIWQHVDPADPSNEEDNVRLQDDYGREGTNTKN